MNATPVDRPSSPSIQLMLLIIPTIQKIVSPAAIGPTDEKRIGAPPSGLAMKSMVIPRATAKQASAIWPSSWTRARRSNRSSIAPSPAATAPPSSNAATSDGAKAAGTGTKCALWLTSRKRPATSRNAAQIARPPPRGTGIVLTRRASGRSTIP